MKRDSLALYMRHITLAGTLLLLAGCQTILTNNSSSVGGVSPAVTSPVASVEREIGAREHPKIIKSYGGLYSNSKLENMLSKLVGRLVAASPEPSRPYRVTILNSPSINAFALPGGYLYVTRGLLALANDKSELAAVLAHEMAHVTSRHALERAKAKQQSELVSRALKNMVGDKTQAARIKVQNLVTLASFSQVQELEADRLGIETAFRAGLDPFAAGRFLKSMGAYAQFLTGRADNDPKANFLSSHPTTPERIQAATFAARRFSGPNVGNREQEEYLNALDGMLFGDSPDEGFVRGRSYIHPHLRIAFTLPQGYRLENTSKAVLAVAKNGTAMRFDGVSVSRDVPLTNYLTSGWVTGLLTGSIRQQQINGNEAVMATAKAKGWTFRIAVIRIQSATYRFVFATTKPNAAFESNVAETFQSFRKLTAQQAMDFKPLTIKIITAPQAAPATTYAAQMQGSDQPERLFRLLNNVSGNTRIKKNQLVKLVIQQR
ncbi:M48 family metalloprotease [Cohaesibacter gelatinilyticus]|uniref:Putative Zn-dependent protease n=1 Tax=Cohaesibacter gelatinilyticus TaxID=372072 RepID=A0A285PIC4_9HYPH|nr:M48 family metalloprotease [Cohaesibacter gelatinilyticus]SNZ21474.1 Putative Zn-dependent protease [Cohaesibacter gelatinilyticus]